MDKYAIIVAGGTGVRMGSNIPKQFMLLHNKPVLWHTLTTFLNSYADLKIMLVLPGSHLGTGQKMIASIPNKYRITLIPGGTTRFNSVQHGLREIPPDSLVFIHDAVRCLATANLIHRCYDETLEYGNAIPAIMLTDSIRIETDTGSETIDRRKLRAVQTPQTFLSNDIKRAFLQDYRESFTDEASVAESVGQPIHLVEGEITNIKITHPIDLLIAEQILSERAFIR